MLNSTCRMLSAGAKFITTGKDLTVRPCCLYNQEQKVNTKQDVIQWRRHVHSIDSFKQPLCDDCNYLERSQVKISRRQISFRFIPDTAEVGDPAWLEIQTDMTCNGGCVICGPEFSSFWAQELGQASSISNRPDYIAQISELVNLQKAVHIVILGGEPMLSDAEERLLRHIDDPSKVTLQITTNGSVCPGQQRFQLWEKFKSIILNFSIDGVGQRFEYLRYPLQWHKVEQNMRRVDVEAPSNVRCKVNHTLSSLNIYYFDEFDQWYSESFGADLHNRGWNLTVSPANGVLSPQMTTAKLAAKISEKYTGRSLAQAIERHTDHNEPLHQFLHSLDQRRGLDWRMVFPEIAEDL